MNEPAQTALSDEQAEALIEESGGYWKEDVFCIGGPELMALLRAASASPSAPQGNAGEPAAIPHGWKLVPLEPTEDMVKAYLKANDAYWRRTDEMPPPPNRWRTGRPLDATAESYKAMLAASPTPPSAGNVEGKSNG